MRENRIQAKCIRRIVDRGGWAMAVTVPPAPVGTPDIIGTYRGWTLAVETKQPGERPSHVQESLLGALRRAGALAFVATETRDVDVILDAIDAAPPRTLTPTPTPGGTLP